MLEPTPIDWSQPVQWNTGEPAQAERVQGFILITLQPNQIPKALHDHLAKRHFKDTVVVHEDTGVPVTTLAEYAPNAWIENVHKQPTPWEQIAGTF